MLESIKKMVHQNTHDVYNEHLKAQLINLDINLVTSFFFLLLFYFIFGHECFWI